MVKVIVAILLAFLIGAVCRFFEIPLPAPPTLLGVGLILAITLGYIVADRFVARRAAHGGAVEVTRSGTYRK